MSIQTSSAAVQMATARADFSISALKQSADTQAGMADLLLSSVESGTVTATRGNNLNITV